MRIIVLSRLWRLPSLAALLAMVLLLLGLVTSVAHAQVRIKDITDIQGIRNNQLVGYGLVVGLNGTGDSLNNSIFTKQSLIGMLERLGVNTQDQAASLQTKDVAAVMVTANLPAFTHSGEQIDVTVSALGDAKNLTGGTLLVTPLLGADGQVYAVAQGSLVTGAIAAQGANASFTQGVPTVGRITNGAIVERSVNFNLAGETAPKLELRNPDFNTAARIARVINHQLGGGVATVDDPRTITLALPKGAVVTDLTAIEELRVRPSTPATVVVDESTGTIVMGADVRISTVAIAQGDLTVRVTNTPEVSQPNAFGAGKTVATAKTSISVSKGKGKRMDILKGSVSLRELVAGLNSLGVAPHDMIGILQAIKADGALQAKLVVE
ncbi:MAG: flagellar biosynthesis protein FlgA [Acidiphilium sp. 21-60-14]|nr:MAG: flagellar biosynthesis protein FlgA [Acidiphilium sp. 21-60-14]OYV90087.1 MAG: flagellar biosynthesis protein FlgA [Acidiphilium sp. 37-60-79]OZB39436.1 MAG: flagellar biosynthesis protein FlgA [Acidiphilium sp. 34-60-192]